MTDAAPAPPDLLAHAAFVRRLARSLLLDAHAAEDVEQETWRAALEHPPRGEPRGWLARVARNFARRTRRGEARRGARERAGAQPEALPPPEASLERTETLQRVVDAVRALEEPYRATILARFYEDLPPRAIAEREGCPVETVNTRLKRGLAQLRVRLERDERDEREWRSALGLLAGESPCLPPHAGEPLALPALPVKAVVLGVAALIAGWTLWKVVEPGPARSAPATIGVSASPDPIDLAENLRVGGRELAAPEETDEVADSGPADVEEEAPAPPVLAATEPGVVRGLVVDERNAPIADALVFFGEEPRARGDEPFKPLRFGRITDGARTGGDGWFELRGEGKLVTAVHADFSGATVEVEQAGRIVLGPRGSIQGWLLDADGRPLAGASVLLDNPDGRHTDVTTDASGWFRFDRVEEGAHMLAVREEEPLLCVRLARGAVQEVELRLGSESPLELEIPGLPPDELDTLEGWIVGLDEVFGLGIIRGGRIEGAVRPGPYWLATRTGIAAPFTVLEGDPRARIEIGTAPLVVHLSERREAHRGDVQVLQAVPPDADAFLRLAAARAYVKATRETPARLRLHPGRYLLVGHAGTVLREVELPPEGLEVTLE